MAAKVSSRSPSAEQVLLHEERTARLRVAMEALSVAQKECLALRAEGLKYREIAQILDLSVSTVGENIQRGLERLKEMI
jgi:RNA polymerase sigma-70 factor (ECF subfamily)